MWCPHGRWGRPLASLEDGPQVFGSVCCPGESVDQQLCLRICNFKTHVESGQCRFNLSSDIPSDLSLVSDALWIAHGNLLLLWVNYG